MALVMSNSCPPLGPFWLAIDFFLTELDDWGGRWDPPDLYERMVQQSSFGPILPLQPFYGCSYPNPSGSLKNSSMFFSCRLKIGFPEPGRTF